MKKKVIKLAAICIAGLFLCACETAEEPQLPTITSSPKVLVVDAATPTPTITLEKGEKPDKAEEDADSTVTPALTPEESATPIPTETPEPTKAATPTPKPTEPPTATPTPTQVPMPEPTTAEARPYEKGELSFDGFSSEWLDMRFMAEEGMEISSQEELDETMRLIEEAATGKDIKGALDYEKLGVVYEMSLVWQDKGLSMQVMVERMADMTATETDYVAAMREELLLLEESGFTYIVDDKTYPEIIAGKEFENFGYTIYYDENLSLHQENYIRKMSDRIVLISIMGETEAGMQDLIKQFEAY